MITLFFATTNPLVGQPTLCLFAFQQSLLLTLMKRSSLKGLVVLLSVPVKMLKSESRQFPMLHWQQVGILIRMIVWRGTVRVVGLDLSFGYSLQRPSLLTVNLIVLVRGRESLFQRPSPIGTGLMLIWHRRWQSDRVITRINVKTRLDTRHGACPTKTRLILPFGST